MIEAILSRKESPHWHVQFSDACQKSWVNCVNRCFDNRWQYYAVHYYNQSDPLDGSDLVCHNLDREHRDLRWESLGPRENFDNDDKRNNRYANVDPRRRCNVYHPHLNTLINPLCRRSRSWSYLWSVCCRRSISLRTAERNNRHSTVDHRATWIVDQRENSYNWYIWNIRDAWRQMRERERENRAVLRVEFNTHQGWFLYVTPPWAMT